MHFHRILVKVIVQFVALALVTNAFAQSVPNAPAEIEFAGVSVQLTSPARQRLQQSLNSLYSDRVLLLRQVELMNQLRPVLDARLLAQGIPLDFRYACPPFTQSPYDPYAYWGLEKSQAQQLQLLINESVDDRRHVLMSTDAVLPRLNQLHKQTGHWIKTLFQQLEPVTKPPLDETSPTQWLLDLKAPNAIWTVLARKIAFEQEQALLRLTTPFVLLEYDEGAGKTLSDIALRLRLNTDRLSPYNTWLLAERIPAEGNFPVILRLTPEEYLQVKPRLSPRNARQNTGNLLINNDLGFPILRRLDPNPSYKSVIFYQINERRGIQSQVCDNAITLSYYGRLSIPTFLHFNDLPAQAILKPGEVYYIERKAKRAKIPFHVVQQSQTLWDISAIYGIRLKSLLHFNRIKATQRVQTGRIVWMQKRRPAKSPIEYQSVPPLENRLFSQNPAEADESKPMIDSTALKLKSLVTGQAPPSTTDLPRLIAPKDSITAKPIPVVEPVLPAVSPPPVISVRAGVTKFHIVKAGQTYFSIAKLYETTVEQLCSWNNLTVRQPLRIGQELRIDALKSRGTTPTSGPVPRPVPALSPPTSADRAVRYYAVRPGETVYRISLNHGVSVSDLMRWNGLKNFTIEVGQRLIVRQPGK